jgi:transposase
MLIGYVRLLEHGKPAGLDAQRCGEVWKLNSGDAALSPDGKLVVDLHGLVLNDASVGQFNGTPDGVDARCPPGRVPALTKQQRAELRELVVKGPDPATDKVVRWRCVDLRTVVAHRFSVTVHVHTISKWLNQLGLTRLQPRPVHPKKDPEAEVTFKTNFASLAKAALLSTTAATPVPEAPNTFGFPSTRPEVKMDLTAAKTGLRRVSGHWESGASPTPRPGARKTPCCDRTRGRG